MKFKTIEHKLTRTAFIFGSWMMNKINFFYTFTETYGKVKGHGRRSKVIRDFKNNTKLQCRCIF